jgi:hypothetical protein
MSVGQSSDSPWTTPVLVIVAFVGAGIWLATPDGDRFPAALVSVLTFSTVLMTFTAARPLRDPVLCPLNWTLLVFFIHLVGVPLLLCAFGPFANILPFLPSDHDINAALLISASSFAAFAIGCALYPMQAANGLQVIRDRVWDTSPVVAIVFAVVGVLGVLVSFGDVANLRAYVENPQNFAATTSAAGNALLSRGTLAYTVGVVLKPFLGIAVVIFWCAWVDNARSRHTLVLVSVTFMTAVALAASYGTFSYNRGSFVAPLVSLAAVYGSRVRRIRLVTLVAIGVAAVLALTAFQAYRSAFQGPYAEPVSLRQAVGDSSVRKQILQEADVNEVLQVYGASPQFLAFLLAQTDYAADLHYGATVVSSALYPVPSLGAPFRASSGVQVYNELIYGHTGNIDQVVPFEGELFLDLQLPGVLVGFLLFGTSVAFLQARFLRAPTALQSFVWQYTATWLAFLVVGSVAVVTQVFVYFFVPIYVLALLTRLQARRVRRTPAGELRATG